MRFLLDTDLISDSTKAVPSARAAAWRKQHDDGEFFISAITLGEIQYGISRKAPGRDRRRLEIFLQGLVEAFSGRILAVDRAVAGAWGELRAPAERAGRPLPLVDGLLAATAKVHDLVVATGNSKDFSASGVRMINPFQD
jgi:predicted nucleic acid-binding protein